MHSRAFMAIDMLFGILIVTTVSVVLLGTIRRENHAESQLAYERSALHLAEHTLLNLQHHRPAPTSPDHQIHISPTSDGIAPAGFIWVKVDVTTQHHTRSLLGVVPVDSIPHTEKNQ